VVELRLLGPAQVIGSNERHAEALSTQPKRLALLAYLAVATPRGFHRRDKIVGLFWPELDAAHARNALSQALHVLRGALGEGAIVTRGDEIRIANDLVRSDAVAFEAALDAGRPDEALRLYTADLLDGFFVSSAPEFDRWLDRERSRLRHRAAEGAWQVAERLAAEANALDASLWAKRAAGMVPLDEAVTRRLMTFLRGLGDRAGALRYYDELCTRMRDEFEMSPSPETRELAGSIRVQPDATEHPSHVTPGNGHWDSTLFTSRMAVLSERKRANARWVAVSVVVAAAALAVGLPRLFHATSNATSIMRFALEFPGAGPITGVAGTTLALSPDGTRLVYVGGHVQGPQLFVRPLDRLEATPIPETQGARIPFFSPDGRWIGFEVGGKIRKVPLAGGPAITICDVGTNIHGASWGPGNLIVFATPGGLWRVQASGGRARIVAVADTQHAEIFRWPELLPLGKAVAFTRLTRTGTWLAVASLETGALRSLGIDGTNPHFVEPGHLVFARLDGTLLTVGFDEATTAVTGPATLIAQAIVVGVAGAAKLAVSRNGSMAYMRESDRALAFVDRTGKAELLGGPPLRSQRFSTPRISPDGKRIAVEIAFAGQPLSNVWVLDLPRAVMGRVSTDSGGFSPVWQRDGEHIAFATMRTGWPPGFAVRRTRADRADSAEAVLEAHVGQLPEDFTPDGRSIVVERRDVSSGRDLWTVQLQGARRARPYLRAPGDQQAAALSPDGRWLAYVSTESGRDEVFVRAFPTPDSARRISVDGGREPRWAANGKELFYRSARGLVSVPIDGARDFVARRQQVLFDDRPYVSSAVRAEYDVHPDGRQFVMVQRGASGGEVVMVLNWFSATQRETR
jgi:DNA-binding SARP family transcriptional activator/Tol biopolymer transport system component